MALPCPVQNRIFTRVDNGQELDYNQARELLFNNPDIFTAPKTKTDAVQIESTAEVPVQPEARSGEEVQGTQPEAESQKPAEEGKEEKIEDLTDETVDIPNKTIVAFHATSTGEVKSGKEAGIHIGTKKAAEQVKEGRNLGKGQVVPVSVKINKPLVLSDMPTWSSANLLSQLYNPSEGKYFGFSREQIQQVRDSDLTEKQKQQWVIDVLKRKGFDAIAYKNDSEDAGKYSYVIFDEKNIEILTPTDESKTEQVQPVPEGVRDGGEQAEGGQAGTELRTQEEAKPEEVAPKSELESIAERLAEAFNELANPGGIDNSKSENKAARETLPEQKKVEEDNAQSAVGEQKSSDDLIGDLFDMVGKKPTDKPSSQSMGIVSPAVARIMQPTPSAPKSFVPKEVQERVDNARKKPVADWFNNTLTRLKNFGNGFLREYRELSQKKFANVIDILRQMKSIPDFAKGFANIHMNNIFGSLNTSQRAYAQDYFLYSDLLGSIEDGLYIESDWVNGQGPFGFSDFKQVRDAVFDLEAVVNADPKLKKAIEDRDAFVDKLWQTAERAGLTSGDKVGGGRSYFHREILKYQESNKMRDNSIGRTARNKKLGATKKRKGSNLDYNTNFAEVEFTIVAGIAAEIAKRQYVKEIVDLYKAEHNRIKAEATQKVDDYIANVEATFGTGSPEHQNAIDNKNDLTKRAMADLMGNEYTLYQPDGSNTLFKSEVVRGDIVNDALAEITSGNQLSGVNMLMNGMKTILMAGKARELFLPVEVAKTFDQIGQPKRTGNQLTNDVLDVIQGVTSAFKSMVLLSPFRLPKYLLGNLTGDFDRISATDPSVLRKLPSASQTIWNARIKGDASPEYLEAVKAGIINSGSAAELGDVSDAAWAKFASQRNPNITDFLNLAMRNMGGLKWSWDKYWSLARGVANMREDAFRLAAYQRAKEKIAKGEKFYWFSDRNAVDQIKNNQRKAAKLARELFGDYNAISESGEAMAKYLYPFYRFRETNIKGYKNFIFNNIDTKAGREKVLKYGLSRGITKATMTAIIAYAQMLLFSGMVKLWNNLMFPDEEDELQKAGDNSFHIILGRREDGSIRYLRSQGTWNAFMESMGISGSLKDIYEMIDGKDVTMAEVATNPGRAFTNEFYQGLTPLAKAPIELASGKSRFPNVFQPRQIRDNTEYVLGSIGQRQIYEILADKPRKEKDYFDLFITNSVNPKEIAYYQALNLIGEYTGSFARIVEAGKSKESIQAKDRSEALYRYKMNMRFGNLEKANKELEKYYSLGGTAKAAQTSIEAIDPLNKLSEIQRHVLELRMEGKAIPAQMEQGYSPKRKEDIVNIGVKSYAGTLSDLEFVKNLTKKEVNIIKSAVEYYKQTYKPDEKIKELPKK